MGREDGKGMIQEWEYEERKGEEGKDKMIKGR